MPRNDANCSSDIEAIALYGNHKPNEQSHKHSGQDKSVQNRSPGDIARARSAIKVLVGEVRIEVEREAGRKVPVAVLQGNYRALLTTTAAGNAAVDIDGSGGRI
jgi:hypothetical protein